MSYPTFAPAGVLIEQPAGTPWHYGLYSAAEVLPEDPDVRWEVGGALWAPDTCASGGLWTGGYCLPANLPAVWALTHGSLPAGMAVTQPDSSGHPLDVHVTPPTPDVGTVTQLVVNYGDGTSPVTYPAPVGSTLDHVFTEPSVSPTTYTVTMTYTYTVTGPGTPQTAGLTFTGHPSMPPTKNTVGVTWQAATPFTVYNAVQCAPVGFADANARANARLGWNEPTLVERGFFYGSQGNRTALASSDTTALTSLSSSDPGLDLAYALGVLEQAGQNDVTTQLTIHAPRALAAWASHERLVFRDGTQLVTPLGNVWAFGAGYGYEGPDGASHAAQAWLYATGETTVRRSQVVGHEVFYAPLNSTVAIAERQVLVTAECVQLAAKVIFPPAPLGAAS